MHAGSARIPKLCTLGRETSRFRRLLVTVNQGLKRRGALSVSTARARVVVGCDHRRRRARTCESRPGHLLPARRVIDLLRGHWRPVGGRGRGARKNHSRTLCFDTLSPA